MKAKHILSVIIGTLLIPCYLSSCGEDRWKAYAEQTATAQWIDDTMRVYYYWLDDLPSTDKVNYFQEPFTFFKKLLSKNDKFSTIDSLQSQTGNTRAIPYTNYSYGFHFQAYSTSAGEGQILVQVLYVAENTPASEIGLQRGDWIVEINGESLTEATYPLLLGSGAMQLTIGRYDPTLQAISVTEAPKTIAPARAIEDNPVHFSQLYEAGGKRVGYLVYNHFSAGPSSNTSAYNQQLVETCRNFAAAGVNEFVLDLRYNNGGLVSCAELLCSLLAPADALGQNLGYLEYNSNFSPQSYPFTLGRYLSDPSANLNLSRVYVLTGQYTASASEMVINCLKPFMEVILIGETTVGKNVGSTVFTNQERLITMSPIICKIFNKNEESDYSSGFTPDYRVNEREDFSRFLPFGDTDECLLSTALGLIATGEQPESEGETRAAGNFTSVYNSLDQLATQAVIIDKR